jgi:hypothetical protein
MKTRTQYTNYIHRRFGRFALLFVSLLIGYSALFPTAHAVSPGSDGNYSGGNTAERTNALASLTTNSNTTANDNAANGAQIGFARGNGWTADVKQGEVVVKQGGEKMCVVKTQLPFVEETRFLNWQGKKCLAVKSRARHGPAALELFDAHTGALVDKIMAFAVENDKPAWAARWKE